MTRRMRQAWLIFVAAFCAAMLVLAVTPRTEGPATLRERPADWLLASRIAADALDSEAPRRVELWRAAHAHAKLLAPHRPNPDAAFVRAGLFHWIELGADDRARVMKAAEPLMRDPTFFQRMHAPLLQVTRDFAWVRAHAPQTLNARMALEHLAVSRGLFGEYRALREEIRAVRLQTFAERRRTDDLSALLNLLPERLDRQHEPLVRGILEELERQAFDPAQISPRVEEVVEFALDHRVEPLAGVGLLLEPPSRLRDATRARVALALNQPQVASRIEMSSLAANPAEWEPYYLDRARFEARRRDAAQANAYLVRAAADGMTVPVLAAAVEVARMLGREADERRYRAQLEVTPRVWQGLCGPADICKAALTQEWSGDRRTHRITLANAQSDETPPYVEIYVDHVRLAEGDVPETRTFEVPLPPGAHEVEVRLVNTHTRNGIQRRVRVSGSSAPKGE